MSEPTSNGANRGTAAIVLAILLVSVVLSLPWLGVGYCVFVGGAYCPAALSPQTAQAPVPRAGDTAPGPVANKRAPMAAPGSAGLPAPAGASLQTNPGANPKYVAIVIGNSDYAAPNALANPRNDATDMAAALEKLGYTLVRDDAKRTAAWLDLGYARLDGALQLFAKRAADAEVALVYYAGHGMEEGGVNYLIPVDAELNRDVDLPREGYAFDNVTRRLPRYGISIVIIDACRTPRFKLADRSGSSRAVEGQRGFQVVEAPDRALFAFSAGQNQRASDGKPGERNSPYTSELVRAMQEPDVKIEDVFKTVRQKFIDRGADQKPEFRDNLGRPNLAFQAPEPPRKPGEEFQDCPACPRMVVIAKGNFRMGAPEGESGGSDSERPVHDIVLAADFAVAKFEVTLAQWDACVAAGACAGYRPDSRAASNLNHPIVDVSWDDAKRYAAWLATQTRKKYRLLSESEWEYAARAGSSTAHYWGSGAHRDHANVGADQCCGGYAGGKDRWLRTAPVGRFPPNSFGLHDMIGNVGEWVEDCWNASYVGAPTNGRAWIRGDCRQRVVRGGSWYESPPELRSAHRYRYFAGNRNVGRGDLGFRVARDL